MHELATCHDDYYVLTGSEFRGYVSFGNAGLKFSITPVVCCPARPPGWAALTTNQKHKKVHIFNKFCAYKD